MKVTLIKAERNLFTHVSLNSKLRRRVCGYARVSTNCDSQKTSYEAQLAYFKEKIEGNKEWRFVGLYSDKGLSGLNVKKRDGLNQMVKDALDGRIDLIITKSISRFSRNIVDTLAIVRKLKAAGVEVYFEKENIHTFTAYGEVALSIMSGISEEESRSISENIKWGMAKKFKRAEHLNPKILGYKKDEDGSIVIDEREAKTVRLIFDMALNGFNNFSIRTELERKKYKTPRGYIKWTDTTVNGILRNVWYRGDALFPKYYVPNFLDKKVSKINGELDQYYITADHYSIISRDKFDLVKHLLDNTRHVKSDKVFSNLYCGDCGRRLIRKTLFNHKKLKSNKFYRCPDKSKNKCSIHELNEDILIDKAILAFNMLIRDRVNVMHRDREMVFHYRKMNKEVDSREMDKKRIEYLKTKFFMKTLKKYTEEISEFNKVMWFSMVDRATVYEDHIIVRFRDGYEVRV